MFDDNSITDDVTDEEWAINNSPGSDDAFEKVSDYFRHKIDSDVVGQRLAYLSVPIPKLLVWGEEDRSVPLRSVERRRDCWVESSCALFRKRHTRHMLRIPTRSTKSSSNFLKSCGST